MRLVRIGTEPSAIAADLRAVLTAYGTGDGLLGGVALLGCTPPGIDRPLDAVLVLPGAIVVVVGVDLPEPALRLEAPLQDHWKVDGWELVRPDGAVNPATKAVQLTSSVSQLLRAAHCAPLPVYTVVAVGPYAEQVVQPGQDLDRGVRILHPTPAALITAVRQLTGEERRCTAEQARRILAVLTGAAPDRQDVTPTVADLTGEGFPDEVNGAHTAPSPPGDAEPTTSDPAGRTGTHRWTPPGTATLVVVLTVLAALLASWSWWTTH